MNPVFPARRRAEQFSSMVESPSSARLGDTDGHADLLPLVGLVTSLRATTPVEARPEFVASLRDRLMVAAETALAPDTSTQVAARLEPAPRRTSRERRIAAAIGGFALVTASASMSVAAQTALPGDTLYPLKRALENVHENVIRDADDKGTTMLGNASGRLDEVDRLSRSGGQDPEVIAQTLEDFSDQAVEASGVLLGDFEQTGRESSIEELRSFTATSLDALERLENVIPLEVRDALAHATQVLDEIDRQARSLCPACSDLPAATSAITSASADLGKLYRDVLDTVTTKPATTAKPPRATQAPQAPSATGEPTPAPKTPVDPPVDDEDPTVLTPDDDGDGGTTTPGDGLDTVVSGLGNVDLGELLTGLTGTVDDVLTGLQPKPGK